MIGQTIAHYTITEKIGQGGMGEVYRATDTKLNRDVALKVLPEAFASDQQRMARFSREAQVLASLNPPNIASIYGLEESEGKQAIVLELVEGATLAERIQKGPIPLEESLKMALQICEALETAHENGVIHRDLKPANIKVTPEGKIKVLDFGLAKAFAVDGADVNQSHSPTLSMAATQQGVILGTAAYMSPEQARGVPVDKRADIWAFGCVLYEMLTGRRAFAGRHVSETMAAILKEEPDWSLLPPETPALVTSLLRRCLRKDPDRRLHHIADARIEIDEATAPDPREPDVLAAAASEDRAAPLWRNVALALGAVVLVLGGYLLGRTRTPAAPEVWNTRQITRGPAIESQASLDPAGQFIVYTSNEHGNLDIYWQLVEGENVQNLTDDSEADDLQPAISPDGSTIAFRSERSGGGL